MNDKVTNHCAGKVFKEEPHPLCYGVPFVLCYSPSYLNPQDKVHPLILPKYLDLQRHRIPQRPHDRLRRQRLLRDCLSGAEGCLRSPGMMMGSLEFNKMETIKSVYDQKSFSSFGRNQGF